jgi:subtilase family serine protease
MHRVLTGGILSAVIALGFAASGNAQVVQRSGNTYHVAVCGNVPAGFARCHAHVVTDVSGNAIQNDGSRVGGFGPADLRDAYKITGNGSSSTIISVVDAFGYTNAETDLGTYRANFGLPACTTANGCFEKLNQTGQQGNYPAQNIGWAQESALDLDMASAMCPSCKVWLVEGNTSSFSDLATAVVTAATLGAHVISNSYGGSEGGSQSLEASYTHAGVAVTASTGDSGFAGGPQFPATTSHVIAVGGTHLSKDGSQRGWTESAWRGAGSGCSTVYVKPSWQTDSGCSKRMEADVSADADPATGVAVYGPNSSGVSTWLVFGGTSVAAPMVGGIYAVNGKTVKHYAKTLYGAKAKVFDVTTGNNGTCAGKPSYFCTAGPGYDGPTGVGTPNGSKSFH